MTGRIHTADLRHPVTILEPTEVSDGMGGVSVSWNVLATVWAELVVSSAEFAGEGQRFARKLVKIRIRYRDDVTAKMRVQYEGELWDIRSLHDPDMRRQWLELDCWSVAR